MNTTYIEVPAHKRKRIASFAMARYNLTKEQLFGRSRTNEIVWARWVGFTLLRDQGFSLHSIGRCFKKDHVTVVHGLRKLKLLITAEKGCAADWSEAKAEFERH